MGYSIGIDTGGTFTDVIVLHPSGRTTSAKTPSTPGRVEGIVNGLELAARHANLSLNELLSETDRFVYGTTVATNAILERSSDGRVGCLVTRGFRDTLFLRRGIRRSIWDCQEPYPEAFVRRAHTREIPERVDAEGRVVEPLDLEAARAEIEALLREKRLVDGEIDALAVCFIHSYAYPEHERQVADLIRKTWPHVFVSASIEVAPEIREYERLSTTVFNAYVGHVAGDHFRALEEGLREEGLTSPTYVMQSNGGVAGLAEVSRRPVNTLFSGPAAGIMAAAQSSQLLGLSNVLAVDMGGTSFDVGLIREGCPSVTRLSEIASYSLMGERIEIHSIGAGGGTVAWVDDLGLLRVGPRSAGAYPGPACYGRGGQEPTVTDANVVLGYIDPGYFLGGELKLDQAAAERSIAEKVAEPLGIDLVQAASGIDQLVRANMVNAMRVLTVERGLDPREFTLMAYGGAGPVHAAAMLPELGLERLVVPFGASTFSAFGLLATDLVHSYSRSGRVLLDRLELETANAVLKELSEQALRAFASENIPPGEAELRPSVDLSYVGQLHELNISLDGTDLDADSLERLKEAFGEKYLQTYRFSESLPIQLVTYRVEGVARVPKATPFRREAVSSSPREAQRGARPVYFEERGGFVPTPVYDGLLMQAGHVLLGPAVIEYPDTTLVVRPAQQATWDEYLNAVIEQ